MSGTSLGAPFQTVGAHEVGPGIQRPPSPRLTALLMTAVLGMAVPLTLVGAASVAKIAVPICSILLASWLSRVAPPRYVVFTLLMFMLSAGLRHFVDWQAGYSKTNVISLTPYLLAYVGLPAGLLHLLNGRPYTVLFTAMLGVLLLGLVMPSLHGNLSPAFLYFIYFTAPPFFGLYLIAHYRSYSAIWGAVRRTFLIAMPLMAGYGIWQFVSTPAWDAYFLDSLGPWSSFGRPGSFTVREFGTMNSPGALATMLATGILLTAPSVRGVRWLSPISGLAALLLTSQRALFGGITAAMLVLAVIGRDRRLRRVLIQLILLVGFMTMLAFSLPGVSKKVEASIGSFSKLDQDGSARVRMDQYRVFPLWLSQEPLGRGLGWIEDPVYVRIGDTVLIDSGIIEGFITLGIPGGMVFFGVLGLLMFESGRVALTSLNPDAQAQFAGAVMGVFCLPFGSQEIGVAGFFLYLCIGLLLASALPARLASKEAFALEAESRRLRGIASPSAR